MTYKIVPAIGALTLVVFAACSFEDGDHFDPIRNRRTCRAEPPEIKDWAYTNRTPLPTDLATLDRWLRQHPDRVNRLFGAFCRAPLHTAAQFGREDLAELLLSRGADVRLRDEGSLTPLHLAAQYGHAGVAAALVRRGADVNDSARRHGRTPLHDAVGSLAGMANLEGRLDVVKLLLAHGANINARDAGNGSTPLNSAVASSAFPVNSRRMTELLLTAGARVDLRDSSGDSVLQQAAWHGDIDVVGRLLDRGADPNARGRDTTPLGAAAHQGNPDMVAFLLAHGADANRTVPGSRHEGYGTPLSLALLPVHGAPQRNQDVRRLKAVQLLLDAGADVDARDRQGRSVLHVVAAHGDLKAVGLLLSGGAGIDILDAQGRTPLHLAIRDGHAAVAALLLDRGADVRVKAQDQTRPLDLAAGDPEMEALVRRYASR